MVEFFKFDRDLAAGSVYISLLALFREPGVATLAGLGGKTGHAVHLFLPVPTCCFEVTKVNPDLRTEGLSSKG